MSRRKAYYAKKVKKAAHLLLHRRHRKPGVKGWELQRALGTDYPKVLKILNKHLRSLDLKVKTIFEDNPPEGKPTMKQLSKARFCIVLSGELTPKEAKMIGWRIDDLAGLAAAITYIISQEGKAARKDVEELLQEKLPEWRVGLNLDRYIRYGYLTQDENENLYLDWRTTAEVDQQALINLLLGVETVDLTTLDSEVFDTETLDTESLDTETFNVES